MVLAAAGFLLVSAACSAEETILYASPDGTGSQGTKEAPCSLNGVRDLIRTINGSMSGNIVVMLRGGLYRLQKPFELLENDSVHDSGSNGFRITYRNEPGETPVLSGAIPVTGWILHDKEKNIYRASVPAGMQSRQFYVNGIRAERARGELHPKDWFKTESGWGCLDLSIAKWRNSSDIEIVSRSSWKHLRCGVASISVDTITPLPKPPPRAKTGEPTPTPYPAPTPVQAARVDMKTPGWLNASKSPKLGPPLNGGGTQQMNNVEWVENAYELLSKPGQWYLDRKEGSLYYIPRPGDDVATMKAELPVLETVLDARGSDFKHRIHDVAFEGIAFKYATWLQPSGDQGYADNQAGVTWVNVPPVSCKTPGGVSVQYGQRIVFRRNVVAHMGGAGIDFGHGPQQCSIIGNCLYDISGNGIFLGEVDDSACTNPDEWCDGNKIENNLVTDVGVEFEDQVGICTGYTRNLSLAHNDLSHLPYSGISVGWGWSNLGYSHHNTIACNKVRDFMNVLGDGGGIYTLGNQGSPAEKTLWYGNYITGGKHAQGMYSDEGSGFMDISSNVVTRVGANWMNIWCKSIHDISVHENFSDKTNVNNHGTDCIVTNNIMTEKPDKLSDAAAAIVSKAGLEPEFATIRTNIPVPPLEMIDDGDPVVIYNGSWTAAAGRHMGEWSDTVHHTVKDGDSVTYSFMGKGIEVLTDLNQDEGSVDVYVDGVLAKTVDCHTPSRQVQQVVYGQEWPDEGRHEIKLVKKGGSYMLFDAFRVRHHQSVN